MNRMYLKIRYFRKNYLFTFGYGIKLAGEKMTPQHQLRIKQDMPKIYIKIHKS